MHNFKSFLTLLVFILSSYQVFSTDGHELWLGYRLIDNEETRLAYSNQLKSVRIVGDDATIQLVREEIQSALGTMLGTNITFSSKPESNQLVVGTAKDLSGLDKSVSKKVGEVGDEGFVLFVDKKSNVTFLSANTSVGLYYGTFHLIRQLQTGQDIAALDLAEVPAVDVRILNHWDNLDRTSERGYAGFAIWDWHKLPTYIDPIYKEYARANASLGINGMVPVNVNSNALILTPLYLDKVKALADLVRPYGIKMYLTARFSAPMEIGGLDTADPLDQRVADWWSTKVEEIYQYVPDFGGFLVKANSEGQPGPHEYGRNHAEGANMLADALKPFGGVVMWRAFVYSEDDPDDRHKQAYTQFVPMDGDFRDNVIIQVKNGAIDFQPREPFHPMFGAMPKTPLMMEFQITQEYLGQATQLVYMAPYYKECLDADTYAKGKGSEVSKVIDGSLHNYSVTGIAGVANIGTDRNWTGHLFGQANWYAFGRLAWNMNLSSEEIADEWIRMTFGDDPKVSQNVKEIMMASREAAVNYMTPLGLHHLMATGHHYGPGPWVSDLARPEWNPAYYHRADEVGIGFDRTKTGTNAVAQYFAEVEALFANPNDCPQELLLWFHHLPWDYKMESGRELWDELCFKYQEGVDSVRAFQQKWVALQGKIDQERYEHVKMLLDIHEQEAVWWRDASLLYFQTFSNRPIPEGVEKSGKGLQFFQSQKFPYAPGIRPRW